MSHDLNLVFRGISHDLCIKIPPTGISWYKLSCLGGTEQASNGSTSKMQDRLMVKKWLF